MITKKPTVIGNSLGIIIDRPILDLLSIDRDTTLEIHTDGDALIIVPQRSEREQRLVEAHKRTLRNHRETFRKLAK